jgi:hypothetical protein
MLLTGVSGDDRRARRLAMPGVFPDICDANQRRSVSYIIA